MKQNKWQEIWEKRKINEEAILEEKDVFATFCELKRADGFDVNVVSNYYEQFFQAWEEMYRELSFAVYPEKLQSVYEVGCGSGVNLFMFQQRTKDITVGGIDYSHALIDIANKVIKSDRISCGEAINIDCREVYDAVISDSVFQYFHDEDYGMQVLEKMYQMSSRVLYISELYDLDKKEECIQHRRSMIEDYDKKYEGLERTFYSKKMFMDFAQKKHCDIKFTHVNNSSYWNSEYLFNCYLYKK